MSHFTPWWSLLGGALVGLASAFVLWSSGRIAGVSGIVGGLLDKSPTAVPWRLGFVAGLVAVGSVGASIAPASFSTAGTPSLPWLVGAGLLVGFGARLGNGCTSGHGVCGVSRLSVRSIVATLTFMLTAALTVLVARAIGAR